MYFLCFLINYTFFTSFLNLSKFLNKSNAYSNHCNLLTTGKSKIIFIRLSLYARRIIEPILWTASNNFCPSISCVISSFNMNSIVFLVDFVFSIYGSVIFFKKVRSIKYLTSSGKSPKRSINSSITSLYSSSLVTFLIFW